MVCTAHLAETGQGYVEMDLVLTMQVGYLFSR